MFDMPDIECIVYSILYVPTWNMLHANCKFNGSEWPEFGEPYAHTYVLLYYIIDESWFSIRVFHSTYDFLSTSTKNIWVPTSPPHHIIIIIFIFYILLGMGRY